MPDRMDPEYYDDRIVEAPNDPTPEIDVQMRPTGVVVTFNIDQQDDARFDEGIFEGDLHLSNEDADLLENLLTEARLNRWGLQPINLQACNVEAGDVIPSLGLTARVVSVGMPDPDMTTIHLGHNYQMRKLSLPNNLEITVHRRIR